jgi:ArsR family transcriptional regulator
MKVQAIEVCCAPLTEGVLAEDEAAELAAMFKLLADPVRLRLLSMIANAPAGEVCACDLTEPLGRSQPTVSHHLSALTDAGLLEREKRGKWAWFRVVPDRLAILRDALGTPVASRR